jgi:ferritin
LIPKAIIKKDFTIVKCRAFQQIVGMIIMEISKELADAINDQITFELYSGYIYLSMAYPGMAHWMEIQADEEYAHAIRFYRHVIERGGKVVFKPIEAPKSEWASPYEAFADAYQHEVTVTKRIYAIGDIADKEGDRAAQAMLKWFYDEQVEEEASTMEPRDTLKMISDNIHAMLMFDEKMGARTPAAPPPTESTAP